MLSQTLCSRKCRYLHGEAGEGVASLDLEDGWASKGVGIRDGLAAGAEDDEALAGDTSWEDTAGSGAAEGSLGEVWAGNSGERAVNIAGKGLLGLKSNGLAVAEVCWVGLGD